MSRISADDVRKVAKLARLDLPEEKIATYTGQLESILEYVGQLESIDTEGVPETTRARPRGHPESSSPAGGGFLPRPENSGGLISA